MPSSRTDAFLLRARWTLNEALAQAEQLERSLGFHLSNYQVAARIEKALKAAGWQACPSESSDGWQVFRADPAIRDARRVRLPLGGEWEEDEVRRLLTDMVLRCRRLGIQVDVELPHAK
jgi:hypothetical protein